jgi:hypothetical protein
MIAALASVYLLPVADLATVGDVAQDLLRAWPGGRSTPGSTATAAFSSRLLAVPGSLIMDLQMVAPLRKGEFDVSEIAGVHDISCILLPSACLIR